MELIERTNKRSCLDRYVHKIISEVSMQTYQDKDKKKTRKYPDP